MEKKQHYYSGLSIISKAASPPTLSATFSLTIKCKAFNADLGSLQELELTYILESPLVYLTSVVLWRKPLG